MKRNMMWQFFVEQESPETTIQNFVVRQAQTNSHFFEWLFDDDALSGVSLDQIDDTLRKDWQQFFHSFDLD